MTPVEIKLGGFCFCDTVLDLYHLFMITLFDFASVSSRYKQNCKVGANVVALGRGATVKNNAGAALQLQ